MTRVSFSGPIFNGQAEIAAHQYEDAAAEAIAEEGLGIVRDRLAAVLRKPTGYYESRQAIDRVRHARWIVHDNKVIYGRWLEGVNEMNKRTRFKGYHTYQLATFHLRLRAKMIAERVLPRFLRRMQ